MNCPQCQAAIGRDDARCVRCGFVVGVEAGSKKVATWIWVALGAAGLLVIVPCTCAGLFLFVGGRSKLHGSRTTVSSALLSDTPELALLTDALSAWSDAHGDTPPARLEELLGTRADGRTWLRAAELPLDRHGNAYDYRPIMLADGWRAEIWTLGRDGRPGGEDADGDELVFQTTFTRQ